MKKMLGLCVVLAVGQFFCLGEAVVGQPAPDFSVPAVDGKSVRLGDYKGKIVVLENYNLDCPYVKYHYKAGAMQDLQAEATGQGVVWLVVNSSYKEADKAKQESVSQKMKATAVIHDPAGAIGRSYGFKTTPHLIILDKQGKVAYNGAIDDKAATEGNPREARNYVREGLKQLAAGEAVAKAQTKPYGCGVKYAK